MAVVTSQSSSPEVPRGLSVLEAVLERITYVNEDTGYTIARVAINGTVGVVIGLSLPEQTLTVLTDEDEQVDYDFAELDELAHAYAVTIHRSQGSEYPGGHPAHTSSWMMLQRNLLRRLEPGFAVGEIVLARVVGEDRRQDRWPREDAGCTDTGGSVARFGPNAGEQGRI